MTSTGGKMANREGNKHAYILEACSASLHSKHAQKPKELLEEEEGWPLHRMKSTITRGEKVMVMVSMHMSLTC